MIDAENHNQNEEIELMIKLFLSKLNFKKIYEVVDECKKRHLQSKTKELENKINLNTFQFIIKTIIFEDNNNDYEKVENLIEMIFNRFKSVSCILNEVGKNEDGKKDKSKNNQNKVLTNQNNYFISHISVDSKELDVYDLSLILILFIKCSFEEKMEMLFNVTDVDNDGYINKKEIQKLIFSINFIFSDEQSPIIVKSSTISQSLASIKSNTVVNMILKEPGNLDIILKREKYITFNELLKAVEKIPNYKFIILPKINIFNCLFTKKVEQVFEIGRKDLKEFMSLTSEIIHSTKECNLIFDKKFEHTNPKYNTNNKNEKKSNNLPKIESRKKAQLSHKNDDNANLFLTKLEENEENKNYSNTQLRKIHSSKKNLNNNINKNLESSAKPKMDNKKNKKIKFLNNDNKNDIKMNYDKITNLEIPPGILVLKDIKSKQQSDFNSKYTSISKIINDLNMYSYQKVDNDNQVEELLNQKKNVYQNFIGLKDRIKGPNKRIEFSMSFLTSEGKEYKATIKKL